MLSILTKQEIDKLENNLPIFNDQEKEYYFNIPKSLLENIKYKDNKIFMILIYGYFKATNKFYMPELSDNNLIFIANKYNTKMIENITKGTYYRFQQLIKEYFGINNNALEFEKILQNEANILASDFIHRKKIFYALINLSKRINIEVPTYTVLANIITKAIHSQKKDILNKLKLHIADDRLNVLDEFLEKNKDSKNRYNLMYYKKLAHSTNKKKMLISLSKFNTIKSKFIILKNIILDIKLTPKIAQYHSIWIEKSQVFQISRKKDTESRFLLLSFVYYQYLIRNDNLIDRFISVTQSAKNSTLRAQKDFSFEQEPKKNNIIKSLEDINLSTLNDITTVIKDKKLSAIKKVSAIESLVDTKSKLLTSILTSKDTTHQNINEIKYDFIEQKSISLQGKLSGILKAIEFDEKTSNKNIIMAINYFKNNTIITNKAPRYFLNDEEIAAIFDSGKFRVSLYKVLLFFYVSDTIKNGTLNLKYSIKYKNFENYMIDKEEWVKNKDSLLKAHELGHLKKHNTFIIPIKEKLETSYKMTNDNINQGFNTYYTVNNDSFILKTPKVEKDDTKINLLSKYFPQSEYLSVIDILNGINEETDFLSSFEHYNNSKSRTNHKLLLATILGYGCNLSISKIGKISKGINENQLDNAKVWYFNQENTNEANDKIISYMEDLEIIKIMRSEQSINHTSSDGQKYNISSSINSTNAGYSFKYFGTNKGVVDYKFIDESHRLFHSQVINVNERESGYVIDGLLNNNAVKSDIHSTDTHGFTEIIFGLTNLLGFSFAPRIKNFKDQQLYSYNSPKFYHNLNYKLTPKRKINEQIIKDSWDDILRFIITIKERKTSATQLLKRLTSYSRQHKLYTALKEFGKIIKTDFLLNYIDDVTFRQRIEKQLNKVEASNKFAKAVFFGNNAEFTVATAEEQNIANNCKRLIQNTIILWNYLYISKKYQTSKSQKDKDDILEALKNSSIVHWSHVNMYGEYDFNRTYKKIVKLIALEDKKMI